MIGVIYETVVIYRDAAWDDLAGVELGDDPDTDEEHLWYVQGRVEAFAEVMSLLEAAGAAAHRSPAPPAPPAARRWRLVADRDLARLG